MKIKKLICVLFIVALGIADLIYIYPHLHVSAQDPAVIEPKVKQTVHSSEWVTMHGRKFYYNAEGKKDAGAASIDDKQYYFDEKLGYMRTGWVDYNGQKRYYGEDGIMLTGEQAVGDGRYYFDNDGFMAVGWIERDGKKYYYGEDGRQYFGKQNIDGQDYWFDENTGALKQSHVDAGRPMVALSYDDGPSAETAKILDLLEANGGRATFFVVGNRVSSYESSVKRAAEMGCEIGNHTWEHKYLDTVGADEIKSQLNKTNDAVEQLTGIRPALMRPTGGRINDTMKANVGMPMIYWSIDTRDWETKNAEKTINNVLNSVKDGDIILMHDLYGSTAEASAKIIPELVKRGYQLVTVSELAEARGIDMEAGKVYFNFYPQ